MLRRALHCRHPARRSLRPGARLPAGSDGRRAQRTSRTSWPPSPRMADPPWRDRDLFPHAAAAAQPRWEPPGRHGLRRLAPGGPALPRRRLLEFPRLQMLLYRHALGPPCRTMDGGGAANAAREGARCVHAGLPTSRGVTCAWAAAGIGREARAAKPSAPRGRTAHGEIACAGIAGDSELLSPEPVLLDPDGGHAGDVDNGLAGAGSSMIAAGPHSGTGPAGPSCIIGAPEVAAGASAGRARIPPGSNPRRARILRARSRRRRALRQRAHRRGPCSGHAPARRARTRPSAWRAPLVAAGPGGYLQACADPAASPPPARRDRRAPRLWRALRECRGAGAARALLPRPRRRVR